MAKDRHAERRAMLARAPLFARLDEAELDALLDTTHTKSLEAREELFHKGDPGSQVYLILRGRLKAITTSAEGDDVVFSIMGPGELFGELGLLAGGTRTATIQALDRSELLVLDRREFLPFLRAHPDVAIKLLEVLARRARSISEMIEDTHFLNLPARLAKKLLNLAARYGVDTEGGVRIELRLSQTELGDLVATTRESVNKQIRAWTEGGVLSMDRGIVTIHRRGELESLAGLAGD